MFYIQNIFIKTSFVNHHLQPTLSTFQDRNQPENIQRENQQVLSQRGWTQRTGVYVAPTSATDLRYRNETPRKLLKKQTFHLVTFQCSL